MKSLMLQHYGENPSPSNLEVKHANYVNHLNGPHTRKMFGHNIIALPDSIQQKGFPECYFSTLVCKIGCLQHFYFLHILNYKSDLLRCTK